MDASILVVGNQRLLDSVKRLLTPVATLVLEMATSTIEAEAIINAQQPDVLILQADDAKIIRLSQWVRSQNRLTWIYQIFAGFSSSNLPSSFLPIDCEPSIQALENGADSFLSLPDITTKSGDQAVENIAQRLLKAQVYAGLRRVRNDRELVQANDLLSAIALSDPLTELNNRRAFEWELPRQVQMARTQNTPISLLMLDIDFFKGINDNYGHLVGDQVLQMVANRLRHNLRFYDTPFRYGGEEFSIILNNTTPQKSVQIGQRICHLIANQPFVIDASLELTITLSIGAAFLQSHDDERGLSLLQRADHHLLAAKANGRNQLMSDDLVLLEQVSHDHQPSIASSIQMP